MAGFEDFWSAWPLAKTAKAKAQAAFRKLTAEDRAKATEAVVTWAANWRRQHPQASDIHPTSYLNQRRWEDEAPARPALRAIHGGRPQNGEIRETANGQQIYDQHMGWMKLYA